MSQSGRRPPSLRSVFDYAHDHDKELVGLLISVSLGLGLYATIMLRAETGVTVLEGAFLFVQLLLLAAAAVIRRWFAVLLILVFIVMTIRH